MGPMGFFDDLKARVEALPAWEVGYPEDVVGEEFAEIVRINFFGTRDGRIPPRPLLEEAYEIARADIERIDLLSETIAGRGAQAMRARAKLLEAAVRKILNNGVPLEANAPSTVTAKGDNRPLRDPRGKDRFLTELVARPAPNPD